MKCPHCGGLIDDPRLLLTVRERQIFDRLLDGPFLCDYDTAMGQAEGQIVYRIRNKFKKADVLYSIVTDRTNKGNFYRLLKREVENDANHSSAS